MKKLAVLLFVLAVGMLALAQDAPKAEVFGGYQYLSLDTKDSGIGRQSMHGFNADLGIHATKNLSVVADFGMGKKSIEGTDVKLYPILFGPRFAATSGKVTPFAEALFGFTHLSSPDAFLGSINKFTYAFGGGLDVDVSKSVAIRLAKFDYLGVRTGEAGVGTLNNIRLSTGIVFKIK
jgi:opacity protein-like surface antigen